MEQIIIWGILVGWLLLFAGGILLMALPKVRKAGTNIGRVMVFLAVSTGLLYALLFAWIVLGMTVPGSGVYIVLALCAWILLEALTVCLLWMLIKKKAVRLTLILLFVLLLAVTGIYTVYRVRDAAVPTVADTADLVVEYAPYEPNTKTVSLNGEATLRLTEDLPRLDGATALFPIYSSFARAVYPKEALEDVILGNENYRYADIEHPYLICTTTAGAYDKIVTGDADIIFAGGPSEEQKAFAEEQGVELIYTPIGKEAFVFFVNAKNPLEDISLETVRDIYSGKTTEWSALGVRGLGKIRAFQREEGSGSQTALLKIMGDTPLAEAPQEDVIDGMGGIIAQTADYKNYKNALGYSFRFYATEMVPNDQIKLLSVGGVAPTAENIENGSYPIASEFYAITRADADENVKAFLAWMTSSEGQEIVRRVGYTPVGE